MIKKVREWVAQISAAGAVKRNGVGALQAYGGEIRGEGYVIHKTGERAGTKSKFVIEGRPADNN